MPLDRGQSMHFPSSALVLYSLLAQPVRVCFALGGLVNKPWSQVSSLLPPGLYAPSFLSRRGLGINFHTAGRFISNVANSRSHVRRRKMTHKKLPCISLQKYTSQDSNPDATTSKADISSSLSLTHSQLAYLVPKDRYIRQQQKGLHCIR